MKVTKRYNQNRRDLSIDIECEECGATDTRKNAYDDHNYWANVVPDFKCKECGKSSNDIGTKASDVHTKFSEFETV